jgi:hypothetical protein
MLLLRSEYIILLVTRRVIINDLVNILEIVMEFNVGIVTANVLLRI